MLKTYIFERNTNINKLPKKKKNILQGLIKYRKRQKFVLKRNYIFHKFTYADIISFYQMVFMSHFDSVNCHERKSMIRSDLENYKNTTIQQYLYFKYVFCWYDV